MTSNLIVDKLKGHKQHMIVYLKVIEQYYQKKFMVLENWMNALFKIIDVK